jgi:RES domain-containing protein
VQRPYAAKAFTGEGARIAGGRWNSPGMAVVYTASSASLAILEMLVHLQSQELLKRYVLVEVTFAEALVTVVEPRSLGKTWRKSPPPAAAQRVGDDWLAGTGSAVLRVPSVIVPAEYNYLLNPAHPDFGKITVGPKQPVQLDPRLIVFS